MSDERGGRVGLAGAWLERALELGLFARGKRRGATRGRIVHAQVNNVRIADKAPAVVHADLDASFGDVRHGRVELHLVPVGLVLGQRVDQILLELGYVRIQIHREFVDHNRVLRRQLDIGQRICIRIQIQTNNLKRE